MLLGVLGKLFTVVAVGGGGVAGYYLIKSSGNSGATNQWGGQKEQKPDCNNPYELRLDNDGASFFMKTRESAEEFLRETYKGKGKVLLRKDDSCPQWEALETK